MKELKQKRGSKEELDQTALNEAVYQGRIKEVKAMLESLKPEQRLALLNMEDNYRRPPRIPLHLAAKCIQETRETGLDLVAALPREVTKEDLYGDSSADDLYDTPKDTDTPKKREVPQGITSIYGKSDSSDLYRDCSADDLYDTSKERVVPQGNTSEKGSSDMGFRK